MKNIHIKNVSSENILILFHIITEDNLMNKTDMYDIIIDKITKEWNENKSMKDQNKLGEWVTPKYSKSEINKAGSIIANSSSTPEERNDALKKLNNWRAAHAYPLQVICSNLRLRNPDATVVQRLKRLESITNKIERFPNMNLYRMQDLGGCRVIVDTVEQVYEAVDRYKNSRIRHILKREYDYIQNPKDSGYRSYHMVYQFHSDKNKTFNKNMLIEIQFRTNLQHTWATAVEMMGVYTKSNLKSSQGNKDILRFFTLVSSVIAIKENKSVCPNTSDWMDELIKEIQYLDDKYHIISTLNGINIAVDYSKGKAKNNYYLLILDYNLLRMKIRSFTNIELATEVYGKLENQNTSDTNIVLVSANSLDALRIAYPNYFVDISAFTKMMKDIISNYESL